MDRLLGPVFRKEIAVLLQGAGMQRHQRGVSETANILQKWEQKNDNPKEQKGRAASLIATLKENRDSLVRLEGTIVIF